jgi:hypothetical protein
MSQSPLALVAEIIESEEPTKRPFCHRRQLVRLWSGERTEVRQREDLGVDQWPGRADHESFGEGEDLIYFLAIPG